jgi:hypothetical protein
MASVFLQQVTASQGTAQHRGALHLLAIIDGQHQNQPVTICTGKTASIHSA